MAADAELVEHLAGRPVDSIRLHVAQVQRVLNAAEARSMSPIGRRSRARCSTARRRPPRRPRRPQGQRSSGIVAPTAGGARSREKMVWEWPELADRLLEEWR